MNKAINISVEIVADEEMTKYIGDPKVDEYFTSAVGDFIEKYLSHRTVDGTKSPVIEMICSVDSKPKPKLEDIFYYEE